MTALLARNKGITDIESQAAAPVNVMVVALCRLDSFTVQMR
tara:strand:+ start:766 stop:888 length:123 start_codon:yes stop_codon:yes gene_type:complete